MTTLVHTEGAVLVALYDVRDPDGWDAACRHRRMWGRLYTDIHYLDADHILLTFRPAEDQRWRAWEATRLAWIEGELGDLA